MTTKRQRRYKIRPRGTCNKERKINKNNEEIVIEEKQVCERCNGNGKVKWYKYKIPCPVCFGE